MKQYETAGARDLARGVRRFALGYLIAWIVILMIPVVIVIGVVGSVVLGLFLSSTGSAPTTAPAAPTAITVPAAATTVGYNNSLQYWCADHQDLKIEWVLSPNSDEGQDCMQQLYPGQSVASVLADTNG